MQAKSDKKPVVFLNENKKPFFLLIYCFLLLPKKALLLYSVLLIKKYGCKLIVEKLSKFEKQRTNCSETIFRKRNQHFNEKNSKKKTFPI